NVRHLSVDVQVAGIPALRCEIADALQAKMERLRRAVVDPKRATQRAILRAAFHFVGVRSRVEREGRLPRKNELGGEGWKAGRVPASAVRGSQVNAARHGPGAGVGDFDLEPAFFSSDLMAREDRQGASRCASEQDTTAEAQSSWFSGVHAAP